MQTYALTTFGNIPTLEEKNDNIHTAEEKKMTIFHCGKKNDNIPGKKKMTIFCDIVIFFSSAAQMSYCHFFFPLDTHTRLVSLVSAVDYRGSHSEAARARRYPCSEAVRRRLSGAYK